MTNAISATICNARWQDADDQWVKCDKAVYAIGLCQGHYRRKLRNKPTDVPLKAFKVKTDHVHLSGVNVSPRVYLALQDAAKAQKVSAYEVQQRIMEEWAADFERTAKRNRR